MRRLFTFALALILPVCGGGPNSPSDTRAPSVAGTYSGPLMAYGEYGSPSYSMTFQTLTLSSEMVVAQVGSQLTITGTVSRGSQPLPLTPLTGHVNAIGFFSATSGGVASSFFGPDCGTVRTVGVSLTFSGNTAEYVERDSGQFCGGWKFLGTLRR